MWKKKIQYLKTNRTDWHVVQHLLKKKKKGNFKVFGCSLQFHQRISSLAVNN